MQVQDVEIMEAEKSRNQPKYASFCTMSISV